MRTEVFEKKDVCCCREAKTHAQNEPIGSVIVMRMNFKWFQMFAFIFEHEWLTQITTEGLDGLSAMF